MMRSSKLFAGLAAAALFSAVAPMAHAAAVPAVTHLTVTATGSNAVGGSVTVTATGGTSNGESFDTSWWVYEPDGSWVQAQNWSTSHTFNLANLRPGSYEIQAESLTPQQLAAGDWPSTVGAHTIVNVETSVAITSATVPTSNGTVTVTAQATNIHDPVYQWWVDNNGQWTQDPYGYGSANTFTFQETSPNELVVAYAKTVPAPNDAGSALGITASQTNTPGDVLWQIENAQYRAAGLKLLEQENPTLAQAFAASGGADTSAMFNAPSSGTVAPLIPTSVPPNGATSGATALYAQSSGGLARLNVPLTAGDWLNAIRAAEQFSLEWDGNNDLTLYTEASSAASASYLNEILVSSNESYGYSASVSAAASNSEGALKWDTLSAVPSAGLPAVLGALVVPINATVVAGTGSGVSVLHMSQLVYVTPQKDASSPTGYQWTFYGLQSQTGSSQLIWAP